MKLKSVNKQLKRKILESFDFGDANQYLFPFPPRTYSATLVKISDIFSGKTYKILKEIEKR